MTFGSAACSRRRWSCAWASLAGRRRSTTLPRATTGPTATSRSGPAPASKAAGSSARATAPAATQSPSRSPQRWSAQLCWSWRASQRRRGPNSACCREDKRLNNSSERLTTDGKLKTDPVFIKDGTEIVYTVQETPTQLSLMRLKLADRTVERLFPQSTTNEFEAAFSADGRYCAFVQSRANLNLKLVIRDLKEDRDAVFDPGGGFA